MIQINHEIIWFIEMESLKKQCLNESNFPTNFLPLSVKSEMLFKCYYTYVCKCLILMSIKAIAIIHDVFYLYIGNKIIVNIP